VKVRRAEWLLAMCRGQALTELVTSNLKDITMKHKTKGKITKMTSTGRPVKKAEENGEVELTETELKKVNGGLIALLHKQD
jgi:hypothetical protein